MCPDKFQTILADRVASRSDGLLHARTALAHFSLITYAVDPIRLATRIPADRFEIPTFLIDGTPRALVSAVPFLDVDFRFVHLAPQLLSSFGQTNYRAYVVDRETGRHCVWFFGTTLGSPLVHIPVALWRIPWHPARYHFDCRHSPGGYERYVIRTRSAWGDARIQVEDSGRPLGLLPGFENAGEQSLILTHPIDGYFYRTDGRLGTYSVWHDIIPLNAGRPSYLYFQVFEDLGLITREEMLHPHSIGVCPQTDFEINLPPRLLS